MTTRTLAELLGFKGLGPPFAVALLYGLAQI